MQEPALEEEQEQEEELGQEEGQEGLEEQELVLGLEPDHRRVQNNHH